jgi:hypothetical protein
MRRDGSQQGGAGAGHAAQRIHEIGLRLVHLIDHALIPVGAGGVTERRLNIVPNSPFGLE